MGMESNHRDAEHCITVFICLPLWCSHSLTACHAFRQRCAIQTGNGVVRLVHSRSAVPTAHLFHGLRTTAGPTSEGPADAQLAHLETGLTKRAGEVGRAAEAENPPEKAGRDRYETDFCR